MTSHRKNGRRCRRWLMTERYRHGGWVCWSRCLGHGVRRHRLSRDVGRVFHTAGQLSIHVGRVCGDARDCGRRGAVRAVACHEQVGAFIKFPGFRLLWLGRKMRRCLSRFDGRLSRYTGRRGYARCRRDRRQSAGLRHHRARAVVVVERQAPAGCAARIVCDGASVVPRRRTHSLCRGGRRQGSTRRLFVCVDPRMIAS